MGQLLVMFDLPTYTLEERRQASKFRNSLLDLGFLMVQESIYLRNCVSYEKMESHIESVKKRAPDVGSIISLFITNRQWQDANNITIASRRSHREINPEDEIYEQVTFW